MADIISIATAVPSFCHKQKNILHFMQDAYGLNDVEKRKLSFLYSMSGINTRYSVVEDYGIDKAGWTFIPTDKTAFPSLEKRMAVYQQHAMPLSKQAIEKCIDGKINATQITHLITVSCTGMAAPGLDLELMEAMDLPTTIYRTSVNFMGCYAAIHALKMAKMICDSTPNSNVIIVTTELCTLHFQQEYNLDNAASSLLFADGSAAVLVSNCVASANALSLQNFYSKVAFRGKNDMSWQLGSKGFLMTLSGYVPQLIEEDIALLVDEALEQQHINKSEVTHWCIHPGGKRIVDCIQKKLSLSDADVQYSRNVLANYGNMSSATVLFVLKEMMDDNNASPKNIFGVAFGPGLTMETFIVSKP